MSRHTNADHNPLGWIGGFHTRDRSEDWPSKSWTWEVVPIADRDRPILRIEHYPGAVRAYRLAYVYKTTGRWPRLLPVWKATDWTNPAVAQAEATRILSWRMGIDRALDVMSSFPVDAMIDYTPQALPESPSRSPYRNPDPHEEYAARDRAARLAAARDFPDDLLPAVLRKFPPDLRARIPVDPDQKTITIYRSVPPGIDEIRPGDWVALDRGYAAQLGRGRILKKTVPLEHVMWAGTDENEWFYVPPNQPPVRQLNSARLKRRLLQ